MNKPIRSNSSCLNGFGSSRFSGSANIEASGSGGHDSDVNGRSGESSLSEGLPRLDRFSGFSSPNIGLIGCCLVDDCPCLVVHVSSAISRSATNKG